MVNCPLMSTQQQLCESEHVVWVWPSFIRLFIHPGLHRFQPGSRDERTVDDGLTEEDAWIGLKPGDELCDLVHHASLCLLFSYLFILQRFVIFYLHQQPHIHTYPNHFCSSKHFISLLIPVSYYLFYFSSETINLPRPSPSHIFLFISLLFSFSSGCWSLFTLSVSFSIH